MKLFLILYSAACLFPNSCFAYSPLQERPLKERVEAAQFVFAGVYEKVIPIDSKGEEIPDDKLDEISEIALLQVRVVEAITPSNWRPTKPVLIIYGGLWFSVRDMRKRMLGKKALFLTNMGQLPHRGPVLIPSYGYFLSEPLEKKAEIQALVKPNLENTELWNHFDRMAQCLKDADGIRLGTTREKVESILSYDKALDGQKEKYVFKQSPYVSIEIEFSRNATDRAKDIVTQVSKPYLSWVEIMPTTLSPPPPH